MESIRRIDCISNFIGEEVGKVYKTNNYEMFVGTWDNRIAINEEPDSTRYKRLKQSIIKLGRNIQPILVKENNDGTFTIIEGHHRYVACKFAGVSLYYIIDNTINLDIAKELSDTTSKWSSNDKYGQGFKHEVPLCNIINDFLDIDDSLTTDMLQKLVWHCLHQLNSTRYPSLNKIVRQLSTDKGIAELKQIPVYDEDYAVAKACVERFVELKNVCNQYADTRSGDASIGHITLTPSTEFLKCYGDKYPKFIHQRYSEFLKQWKEVCRFTSRTTKTKKEIYNKLTSASYKIIEQGIFSLL